MFSRVKTTLAFIATALLMIVTLGGYARYQKRRADKAQAKADEAQRVIDYANAIEQRMYKAKKENYTTRQQNNERKNKRTFFDNL